MAEIPTVAPAAEATDLATTGRKIPRLIVSIIAAVVVLAAGGGAAWWFLGRGEAKPAKAVAAAAAKPSPATPAGPPLYVALDPPFVTNFEAEQMVRFLQVTVQVMTRDPATVEALKANDPVIRNDLLLLLGNQKYADISAREGKERLREEALATVRRDLTGAGANGEKVEAVYFTSFVMQ